MIISNAKIFTGKEWINRGWVEISNGEIVNYGKYNIDGDIDCNGAYLLPGLIDLHNCSLKSFIAPRMKSKMPQRLATSAHEVLCLRHGITTAFHTIRASDLVVSTENNLSEIEEGIFDIKSLTNSRSGPRQFIHLRCDLAWDEIVERTANAVVDINPSVISFIRCCPGVGRFHTADIFHDYVFDKTGSMTNPRKKSPDHRKMWANADKIIKNARRHGLKVFFIHDPSTSSDISNASRIGINVAEFPVTIEVAQAAQDNNIMVCMGAPNIVSGESQYGNLRAFDVWQTGILRILTSDYYSPSLLSSIFSLAKTNDGIDDEILAESLRYSTEMPARLLGWTKYGCIDKNMNADLIMVSVNEYFEPEVKLSIVSGKVKYSQSFNM